MTRKKVLQAIEHERAEARRGRMLNMRLSASEYARLETAAKRHKLAVTPFARAVLFAALDELDEGRDVK